MKNETTRTKTISGFSSRAVALALCFVMLLTAIGSGSVLSAIAADFEGNGAAVLVDAAEAGADVDIPAADEAEDKASDEPFVDDIEDGYDIKAVADDAAENSTPIARRADSDLADTGRDIDLADTGAGINLSGCTYVGFNFENGSSGTVNGASSDGYRVHLTHDTSDTGKWYSDYLYVKTTTNSSSTYNYYSKWVLNWGSGDKWWAGENQMDCGSTIYPLIYENGSSDTLKVPYCSSGYKKIQIDAYNNTGESGNGRYIGVKVTTSDVSTLSGGSITATSPIYAGGSTSLSNNNPSGGSGSYTAGSYSVTRVSGDSTKMATVTGNTFYAPDSVSTTTKYKVSVTYTDDKCPGIQRTLEKVITVNPKKTATVSETNGSDTYRSALPSITTSSSTPGSSQTCSVAPGSTVYVYTNQLSGYAATLSVNSGAVDVERDNAKKFHFTMPSGDAAVTVTYSEATTVPVKVYAGTGGSVTVTYNGKTAASVESGENATVQVYEGDSISLTAAPATNYTFNKWKKNLNDSYKTGASNTTISNELINGSTVYVAAFTAGSGQASGWLYSGTDAASRTEVTPTSGMSTFDISKTGNGYYGQFRFMYGTADKSLNTALAPSLYATPSTGGNPYWVELTSAINGSSGNFFFGLCSYENQGNLIGNNSEEINDSSGNKTIKDANNNVLFYLEDKSNNDVTGQAHYVLIRGIDWTKVAAIGVKAYDNSKSSNGNNTHNGKVDYQIYYKAKSSGSSTDDTSYTPAVTYYAKDSAFENTTRNPYFQDTGISTSVTAVTDLVTASDQGSYVTGKATKGAAITVSTTISGKLRNATYNSSTQTVTYSNSTDYAADKYYIVGYSFNGETPQILSPVAADSSHKATYTCTYTIDEKMEGDKLEITPIYWLKDSSNCATFYVTGFEDVAAKQADWGNTLFIYPFYKQTDSSYNGKNAGYGVYPGQPIVKNGGHYYTQIPLTEKGDANSATIKGITINNGEYDTIHKTECGFVTNHRQTYDYDDFYKIANEKKTKNGSKYLESIYFEFKYYDNSDANAKQHRTDTCLNNETNYRSNEIYEKILGTNASSVTNTAMTQFADTESNAWETLTDPLGNNVDLFGNGVTVTTDYPVRAISMGYQYNNAGKYATEWAIYAYDTSTSRYKLIWDNKYGIDNASGHQNAIYNGSIVPSALYVNSAANVATYTGLDSDLSMAGYKNLYTALEAYKGYPVKISYEKELKKAGNSAYRCDGRWGYTSVDNFVQSEIKIEYTNKEGTTQYDTFDTDSNVGVTSKCSAYFTSGDYEGKTISDTEVISNLPENSYTFTANATGNYEFVGWYRQNRSDTTGSTRTTIGPSVSGSSLRSTNSTFIAKFRYVGSGNLTISHTLPANQIGRATTYLDVYLVDNDNNEISGFASPTNTNAVKLDKSVINTNNKNLNYKIKVVLQTVPLDENSFSSYSCTLTDTNENSSTTTDSNYYKDGAVLTTLTEIYIPINGGIFNSSNDQVAAALTYVSNLTPVVYNYNIKYQYNSRAYGLQAYTKSGSLTPAQIKNINVVVDAGAGVEKTNTDKKKLQGAFLTNYMPYESDFLKDITYDFSNQTTVNGWQTSTYNSSTNTYTINVIVPAPTNTTSADATKNVQFSVPYGIESNNTASTVNIDGYDYGVYASTANTFNASVQYDNFPTAGGERVSAPAILYDNSTSTKYYFQYWDIRKGAFSGDDSVLVARDYFPQFNYRILDSYYITAVYTDDPDKDYNYMYANDTNGGDTANGSTAISFLGNSRNQWNSTTVGSNSAGKGTATYNEGDVVYSDLSLYFKPASDSKINEITGAKYGMVLERVAPIAYDQTSKKNSYSLAEYEALYKTNEDAAKASATKVATGSSADTGFTQSNIAMESLSDKPNSKNRLHYVFPVWNSRTGMSDSKSGAQNSACKWLYRAYSYMTYTKDGNTVTVLSDRPTYFFMYDEAIK